MKKIALLLGFLVLTSQLPLCAPCAILPANLVDSIEYGRQWTGMFLRVFGGAPQAPITAQPSPRLESNGYAFADDYDVDVEISESAIDLASLAVPPVPPIPSANLELPIPLDELAMDPVVVKVALPPGANKEVAAKMQKEIECAMKAVRVEMKKLTIQQRQSLQRVMQFKTFKSQKATKYRFIFPAKSA